MADLVWAKQKYSCYWPARIVETPPEMKRAPKNQICVFFFGTHQLGFVAKENIENYQVCRQRFATKCQKNSNFQRAVMEADSILSDSKPNELNSADVDDSFLKSNDLSIDNDFIMANDCNLVWAKQKYSCYWPARIVETPPEMKRAPKNQICVFFFGTHQFGFVAKENIENYQVFRQRFAMKCQKSSNFQRAVMEADSVLSESKQNGLNSANLDDSCSLSKKPLEYVDTSILSSVQKSNILYDQIYKQIKKMSDERIASNIDQTEQVEYKLIEKNQSHSVKVAKTVQYGSCLFGSIAHQIFHLKINSLEHERLTKQLRQNVVEYIREHYSSFEGALQDRVSDESDLEHIKDERKAYRIFLNEYLSRGHYWGGHETIQAVQEMFRVNILILRENSADHNYFWRFNEPNTRILILAYRLEDANIRNSYNHYDSVCNIPAYEIFLSKRQKKLHPQPNKKTL